MSVCQKLKISVTTKSIGLFSSGNISTGPVMVLSYFLGGWDIPNPPPKKKKFPQFFKGESASLSIKSFQTPVP